MNEQPHEQPSPVKNTLPSADELSAPKPQLPPAAEAEAKRKDSGESKEEQGKPKLAAKITKIVKGGVKRPDYTMFLGACLPEDLEVYKKEKKLEKFVTDIIVPILDANQPYKIKKIFLFVGSITTDRPVEKLLEETDRDRQTAYYFQQGIKQFAGEVDVEVLSWAHLAGKSGYRDLYQRVQQLCSYGDTQKAILGDAQSFISRQRGPDGELLYPEDSEEYAFFGWYANWRINQSAPDAENAPFMSVRTTIKDGVACRIPIESNIITTILEWQNKGVYEADQDRSYLDTLIEEEVINPEKITPIAKAFYDAHPELNRENINRIEKAAEAFLLTLRYLMRETAGFLALGDTADLSASFCRDLVYRRWLKAMEIIWKENPGPFLKTEQAEVEIFDPQAKNAKKRAEKKKRREKTLALRAAATQNNQQNSPPPSNSNDSDSADSRSVSPLPLLNEEAKEDGSSPPTSPAPPSPPLASRLSNNGSPAFSWDAGEAKGQDGEKNSVVYDQNARIAQQIAVASNLIEVANRGLAEYRNKTDPYSMQMQFKLVDLMRQAMLFATFSPHACDASLLGREDVSSNPSKNTWMPGLMTVGYFSGTNPSRPQPPALAEKALPPVQGFSSTVSPGAASATG